MKRIFDETSIDVNRRAMLSDRQKRRLWWEIIGNLLASGFAYVFIIGIARRAEMGLFLILLASAAFLFNTFILLRNKLKDLRDASVWTLTGTIRKVIRLQNRRNPVYIEITDYPEINLSDAQFASLLDCGRYRLYLTEHSNTVMNFESLDLGIETRDPPRDLKFLFYRTMKFITTWGIALIVIASLVVYNLSQYASSH